eukprot:m.110497 g.110497  ORF g.110497 m.110497 type:complete len:96 (+) comp12887_c1_seq1:711-998(+)
MPRDLRERALQVRRQHLRQLPHRAPAGKVQRHLRADTTVFASLIFFTNCRRILNTKEFVDWAEEASVDCRAISCTLTAQSNSNDSKYRVFCFFFF